VTHRLTFRPPLAFDALLEFLERRAVPGVEEVAGGVYRSVVRADGRIGVVSACLSPDGDAIVLELDEALADVAAPVLAGVGRVFDIDADPGTVDAALAADPRLRSSVAATPGLRVSGSIDGFELAVRAVLGQQISVVAARTMAGRLAIRLGEPLPAHSGSLAYAFPRPEAIASVPVDGFGMPASRGRTLVALARAICDGELELAHDADRAATRAALLALPGIGPWTASYVAMRALGDPDAFPASDLVLRQRLGDESGLASVRSVEQQAERWRPYRAYAAVHLWRGDRSIVSATS
jgi:AraC family transcriptional regulator of adaptative response / DNA-3-methyladenine glycosylase II